MEGGAIPGGASRRARSSIVAVQQGVPDNVARGRRTRSSQGYKDGSYDVFTGPIVDQSGKERVAKGERMPLTRISR